MRVLEPLFSRLIDFLSRTCLSTLRDFLGIWGRHTGTARIASSRPEALVLLADIAIDDLFCEVEMRAVPPDLAEDAPLHLEMSRRRGRVFCVS